MTDTPCEVLFAAEAAEYLGLKLGTFRNLYEGGKRLPIDGHQGNRPYWKRESLDALRARTKARAILHGGRTLYPSVYVAKALGMTRSHFSLWWKTAGFVVSADAIVRGRPYFSIKTIDRLRVLRAEIARG